MMSSTQLEPYNINIQSQIHINLLHYTPLHVCAKAIRTCWDSHAKSDNGGNVDKDLIYRVGNKNKHKSTLEHLVYSFEIIGISRACLQELSRHRIASLSVKSTRYTLKELRKEISFCIDSNTLDSIQRAKKYIVFTNDETINKINIESLERLRTILVNGTTNDIAKYCLPECYKTQLVWTINARSLQNFLQLRSAKVALQEIQNLAKAIFHALPQEHCYLFEEFMNDSNTKN